MARDERAKWILLSKEIHFLSSQNFKLWVKIKQISISRQFLVVACFRGATAIIWLGSKKET